MGAHASLDLTPAVALSMPSGETVCLAGDGRNLRTLGLALQQLQQRRNDGFHLLDLIARELVCGEV